MCVGNLTKLRLMLVRLDLLTNCNSSKSSQGCGFIWLLLNELILINKFNNRITFASSAKGNGCSQVFGETLDTGGYHGQCQCQFWQIFSLFCQ